MVTDQALNLHVMLAAERRARLAAEQLLAQKQAELTRANKRLGDQARHLSDEITIKRKEVRSVRHEAEHLKGQQARAQADLVKANHQAVVAERRLWDALGTVQDGFAVYNRGDKLVIANRAYLALFDGLNQLRPGITYGELLAYLLEEGIIKISGESPGAWQDRMLARWDLEECPPETLALWDGRHVKLIDRRGHDGDMVSLVLDITETVQHQTDLQEARDRAEAAARAKSAFLANMSHEIRTPMNGILGMAELLTDSALEEEQRLYAETIKSSAEALLVIINDILDFSKIEAEKLVLHPETFDLEQAIHEVLVLLQPSAAAKGLDLLVDFDLFLPTRFIADPGRMRQILTNLIGNAVKFTAAGHVLVRVTGYRDRPDQPAYTLHITVEDTGIGIAEDQQDLIFGEFDQVEDARNRSFEGTGLGLAITRQLVELMEGEIWVESVLGEGACFGVKLRLDGAEEPRPDAMAALGQMRTVLVVDDQQANCTILEKQLSVLGLRVTAHRSAASLLADPPHIYDLILIDHEMPELPGLELARQLRAHGLTQPIALLAANPGSLAPDLPQGGQIALLQKPVLRRDLYEKIASLSPLPRAAPAAEAAAPTKARRMRLLAAEDNQTNQLVLRKMLKEFDLDLTIAQNGREAVDLYRTFRPDLIFMDISMPEMDGKEATRQIRAIEAQEGAPRTPICALTAHAMEGDDQGILAAGLDYYLTKPLRKPALRARILDHAPPGADPLGTGSPQAQAALAASAERRNTI